MIKKLKVVVGKIRKKIGKTTTKIAVGLLIWYIITKLMGNSIDDIQLPVSQPISRQMAISRQMPISKNLFDSQTRVIFSRCKSIYRVSVGTSSGRTVCLLVFFRFGPTDSNLNYFPIVNFKPRRLLIRGVHFQPGYRKSFEGFREQVNCGVTYANKCLDTNYSIGMASFETYQPGAFSYQSDGFYKIEPFGSDYPPKYRIEDRKSKVYEKLVTELILYHYNYTGQNFTELSRSEFFGKYNIFL